MGVRGVSPLPSHFGHGQVGNMARYEHLPIHKKAMDLAAVMLRSHNTASREKRTSKTLRDIHS
jgi:hypothetical protein